MSLNIFKKYINEDILNERYRNPKTLINFKKLTLELKYLIS